MTGPAPAPLRRRRRWFDLVGSPAAFALLVVALTAGSWNYLVGEANRAQAAHNTALITDTDRLLSAVKDLETGERGFVLAGTDDYLAPYYAAIEDVETHLAALGQATGAAAPGPTSQGRSLAQLVEAKRDVAALIVATRRNEGFEAATALVRTGDGKRLMEEIRTEIRVVQAASETRIADIRARDRLRSLALSLLTGLSGLAAILMLARLALIRRRDTQRAAALLDGVLSNAPLGLGFLDRGDRIRHMNRALSTMSERGFGAELGAPIWARLPGLKADLAPKVTAARDHGLVTADVEVAVPTASAPGGVRHFLMSFYPLQIVEDEGDTTVDGVGFTVLDETLRKGAERSLRRSEERFRSLIEASTAIVWSAAASGEMPAGETSWTRFTGQTEKAYSGVGFLDAIHPDDRAHTRLDWERAVSTCTPYETEHRLRRRDGVYRHMSVRAVPILAEDGSLREWVGTHSDITERKEAELAVAAAKEAAEEANRAKSQFIANMSHELRTPLSAVIGYSEMLQEELEDLGEPTLIADMKKIESNARHLLGLINDVLDLSKIEAERIEIYAEEFSVDEVVRDVAATVEGLVEKKGNALDVSVPAEAGLAHTDQTKLRQCLINLLSNAAKFTENGRIRLDVSREVQGGADWLAFTVSDDGIGMSPEQVGRLFERFTQADASTTRRFGGTGLGLSITRSFAQMLGGEISVESREGEGTRFTMRLPATYGGPETGHSEDAHGSGIAADEAGGARVLVIDDDPSTRDLLARFLERDGFSVATASDGRAGLAQARALRPRVILLDVTMPHMDGWSVLRALRADPDLGSTPIIMVTVLDEQTLAFSLGATDYLHKPIEWSLLKDTMDRFRPTTATGPILVVDDDADAGARMETILTREGFSVRLAAHGRLGLEAVERERPGLILLDLMMPELDGFGFLRSLRARPEWRDIPVVILTAKDVTAEDRRRLAGRADRVIRKGALSLADLAQELRGLLAAKPA